MPIKLQMSILSNLIGESKTEAWRNILVGLPFLTPSGDRYVNYNTGQPMGAYSSWPIMALSHHYIVRLAAIRAGYESDFDNYCILGDDIVIANDHVASEYRTLLSTLDMPLSEQKTHSSEQFFEFAKRYFYRGLEISPFQVSSVQNVVKRYYLLQNFLSNHEKKGWVLNRGRKESFLIGVQGIFGIPIDHARRISKLFYTFELVMETKEKGIVTTEKSDLIRSLFAFPVPCSFTLSDFNQFIHDKLVLGRQCLIREEMTRCSLEMEKFQDYYYHKVVCKYAPNECNFCLPPEVRGWHPFGACWKKYTIQAIEEFTQQYDPDHFNLRELLHFRGLMARMMRTDTLRYRDNKVEILADAHLVKLVLNQTVNDMEYRCLAAIAQHDIFNYEISPLPSTMAVIPFEGSKYEINPTEYLSYE
uniref:RNA-dependent RNA polymerase n=2 Tax=araluen mito-like virus TaxID=2858880 RepID=A0A8F5XVX0_9VIRU|nr:RNA-dependent RNA polymerase [araluen mito-like virus]